MKFPIGVQLYSVRDDMEADFEGTLKKVKEMGYDAVEFAGLFDRDPIEVKKLTEELGLVPLSAHVPIDDMVSDPDGVLGDYQKLGVKFVVVPYLSQERRPGTDGFAKTVEDIRMLGEKAKALGMTLLYHNHDFEFVKIDGKAALDVLYETVPSELLQTQIDTCWVKVAGVDPAEYVKKYKGRAPLVHFKDYVGAQSGNMYKLIGIDDEAQSGESHNEEEFAFRPVGYGVQDVQSLLEASVYAGAKWIIVEQDNPSMGKTALESIEMSIKYLSKINK